MFSAIDLSQLPPPNIIEPLSFEEILQQILGEYKDAYPQHTVALESEPLYKWAEICAYRELNLRQKINDGARAVTLATATGADLDNVFPAAVKRKVLTPAQPNAFPPIAAVLENDTDYRQRKQLAIEGLSSAGSRGAYKFHALSAHPSVKDVAVDRPEGGVVRISVLSREGNGSTNAEVLAAVEQALNAETVRPLCDTVQLQSTDILEYQISAEIIFFDGPDRQLALDAANNAINQYINNQHRNGYQITRSGIHAALHQPGVQNVVLNNPAQNINVGDTQAAYCTSVYIVDGGVYE